MSEAGRGKVRQELLYSSGASKAHYGESAHNYNCAVDTFFLINGKLSYDKLLYTKIKIPDTIYWYGGPYAVFYERPHFEVKDWKDLKNSGSIKLVE